MDDVAETYQKEEEKPALDPDNQEQSTQKYKEPEDDI